MNLLDFLKEKTAHSSLRLMCVATVFSGDLAILVVVVSEMVRTKPDWVGAAVTITAIGGIIGVALWGKNAGQQKENTP